MVSSASPPVDLDQWLGSRQLPAPSKTTTPSRLALPNTDRMVIVGAVIDDSRSIANANLTHTVIDGMKLVVQSLQGARGADYYLDFTGFDRQIFDGMLSSARADSFDGYDPSFGSTPLVATAVRHLVRQRERAGGYREIGIPVTISLLLLTDGLPVDDPTPPQQFGEMVNAADYIVGMGIAPKGDKRAEAVYRGLFQQMGITRVYTPSSDPADVRHAMNEFSQSVASIGAS